MWRGPPLTHLQLVAPEASPTNPTLMPARTGFPQPLQGLVTVMRSFQVVVSTGRLRVPQTRGNGVLVPRNLEVVVVVVVMGTVCPKLMTLHFLATSVVAPALQLFP